MTHHENAYFIDSHLITRPHSFGNPLSQILSKHLRIPCLTAIPYLFAMASMASVKESRLLFIDFLLSLCLER